ncbi:MAG: AraC family transcriptional regulator [Nitrospirota bacterium]
MATDASKRQHVSLSCAPAEQKHRSDIPQHILERLLTLREYIEERFPEKLDLQEACRLASVNRTYLSSFFKLLTGYTLTDYQNRIRIQKAEELIRETDLPVHEVALRVGFTDPNYFCKRFKSLTGHPPLRFRKLHNFL